jgi:hypothetical protein
VKRLLLIGATLLAVGAASAAVAAPGTPPAGISAIAGSIYTAQFATCSLDTIAALGRQEGLSIGTLAPGVVAERLAQARNGDLGTAAVRGCRAGLLYRLRNDRAFTRLRSELSGRITAEKYVAGVYGLFVLAFFAYVMIHVAKVSRLRQELDGLRNQLESRADAPSI